VRTERRTERKKPTKLRKSDVESSVALARLSRGLARAFSPRTAQNVRTPAILRPLGFKSESWEILQNGADFRNLRQSVALAR